jgi:16S rRNA processing protein RimM
VYIIGYVLKPQGTRGEIKVKSVSPDPERFKKIEKVFLKRESLYIYSIERVRIANKFIYLKFAEINSREEAELLRNCDILVDKKDLIALTPGEYFVHDLIGCDVITEKGKKLGEVVDVIQMDSNDVYVVRNKEGEEILLPAIKDVIKGINIEKKLMKVHLIAGIIE